MSCTMSTHTFSVFFFFTVVLELPDSGLIQRVCMHATGGWPVGGEMQEVCVAVCVCQTQHVFPSAEARYPVCVRPVALGG